MTLLSMQDGASSTVSPLNCEHCDSGDSAVSRCSDCSVFMCEFCVTAHKRINATKNHQILTLTEVKKLGAKALAKPMFCSRHKGETLKLFCNTCQKTICRDCTIVNHREHKYDFVTEVAEKEKGIIRGFLTKAKDKLRTVVEGLTAVQMMKNGVEGRVSEVNKEIDTFFDEQVKALNYYRANIKHEVSTQGQIRVSKLKNQAEVLSSFLAQLKSGISFTDQALQDGDDVKLLAMKKQLVHQLDQLNSSKTSCKPCMDDYLELQVHQTIWDMEKLLSVCYVPLDPQKCTVSMLGGDEGEMYQTLAGQEVELLLLLRDKKGQKQPKGGHQVEATVSFYVEPGYLRPVSPVPVRDNGDGSYSFSYHPVEAGKVSLSVRVEKQQVRGSPFEWNVISGLPDGASSPQRKGLVPCQVLSGFTEGMYCWKLQLTSFSNKIVSELEIGVTASNYYSALGYGYAISRPAQQEHGFPVYCYDFESALQAKWSWKYSAHTKPCHSSRSDGQVPSITSVENNDVFIVFLNLRTKKLTIYNVRSKQTEIFTGIEGGTINRIGSPSVWEGEVVEWVDQSSMLALL